MPKIQLLMPDDLNFEKIREVVCKACEKLSLEVFSDSDESWKVQLENAAFVIADITSGEDEKIFRNVFRVGYAWRAQKTVLLISQKEKSISMGQERTLLYDSENLDEFMDIFISELIALCHKQRIRYARYPGMPELSEQTLPILPQEDRRVENYVAIGDSYVNSYDYDEAHQEYSRAILRVGGGELKSHHAYIFFKRAFVCKRLEMIEEALVDYCECLELKPNYVDAYVARGLTFHEQARYEEALIDFKKAAELKPDFTRAYVYAGLTHRVTGHFQEAIEQLNQAIELSPKFPEAFYHRGLVYVDMQEYEKAIEDFSQAIEINENYTQSYIRRGSVYMSLQKYEEAIEDFNRAIELDPKNVEAYKNRGQALFEKGYCEFHQLAIDDWQKAIDLGSTNVEELEEKIQSTSRSL